MFLNTEMCLLYVVRWPYPLIDFVNLQYQPAYKRPQCEGSNAYSKELKVLKEGFENFYEFGYRIRYIFAVFFHHFATCTL